MNASRNPGSKVGSSNGVRPDTAEQRRDGAGDHEPTDDGHDHDQVLGEARGAGPEDLAGEQLTRGGGRDEQLHDPA